jgi:hypothetical protein
MNKLTIPQWAQRFGFIGFILVILLALLNFIFEAIFQQEIQDFWINNVKPFLFSSVQIHFEVSGWLLLLIIIAFISLVGFIGFLFLKYMEQRKMNGLNINTLKTPKEQEIAEYNQGEIIKAIVMAGKGELSLDTLATIMEQAVNFGRIKPEVGAETLKEFNYELALESDGNYKAVKQRR